MKTTRPDFEKARQYALQRLETELPPRLLYHGMMHTRDDTVPAAERLAVLEGVEGEERILLLTAVWYHDIGFTEQYEDHESASMRIAAEVLPEFGYSLEQIEIIRGIIQATRIPQKPHTLLEQIMADADLDLLGRDDFWQLNQALYKELAAVGKSCSTKDWYRGQLAFLQSHEYFTASAKTLRAAGKQANIRKMKVRMMEPRQTTNAAALLRTVSLFAETPDETLDHLATLLRPIQVEAGKSVFQKGDCGDSMYIIVEGRVRVHDGDMTLNFLGPCDVFGEMALLDTETRSASVTAVETTHLMQLDQEAFQTALANYAGVALGVIRVLNRRLRARLKDMAQDFAYMQQMARISASAVALEAGRYDARTLDEVCQRPDELGQLARVFQRMADEVIAREQRLKEEVMQLRIQIDEEKKKHQVEEITETDFFKSIQEKASELRAKKK
ncbi:MAG: cyclic nucleotide-binding domain-containing protein [Chloroflexota bacterium]